MGRFFLQIHQKMRKRKLIELCPTKTQIESLNHWVGNYKLEKSMILEYWAWWTKNCVWLELGRRNYFKVRKS